MALFHRAKPVIATGGSVEEQTQRIGRDLLQRARSHSRGFFSSAFWSNKLMEWATKDPAFKVQLFRFVDVFPTLKSPEQIHEHLIDYLTQPSVTLPTGMSLGLKAGGVMKGALAGTISSQIHSMAEKFIAGADAESAVPTLRELWDRGLAFSVDLLGEACVSDAEASAYQQRYLDLIERLPTQVASWPPNPILESDHLGPIPRANVSVKISALYARTKPIDTEGSVAGLLDSLRPILEAAKRDNVLINFDMEQHELKDLTIALFQRACERFDFPAGIAIQAYLRSGEDDARRVIELAQRIGRQITVRLIKGAYWDYETIHAEMMNWPSPVWTHKSETDACFERMTKRFVDAIPTRLEEGGIKLAIGTHNARSIAHALALVRERHLPDNALEIQMLHGMADELKGAVVNSRLRLREYVPIGALIPGMAYLVRRLLENTSNESWLRAGFMDGESVKKLLAPPVGRASPPSLRNGGQCQPYEEFRNEPPRDWSYAEVRSAFAGAVDRAIVPSVANVGTIDQARDSVSRALAAFTSWRDTSAANRANILTAAAAMMRSRRDELSGIVVKESGKPWAEADADVCEAIDFCEFYAREAPALFQAQRLGKFVGELNEHWHQPRGVAVVISPWNFPMSICCGMTTAALVTGNTVIVKPAEQTPGIAKVLCEILWQAGAARDVLQFLPGKGETIGAALVRDPRVALIAFTGSKAVGLDIIQAAGITPDSQPFVKKVVCEMGGKNAIIVDSSADLDEAVLGVRQSAFSYAGQKCSACSRAIVLDDVHDLFLQRLVESTRALIVGDPCDPATDVGPVIDDEAATKIRGYIEIGKSEGKLELGGEVTDRKLAKPLIAPHIFSGICPEHRLAREEIFGPVLSVIRARTFDEALTVANSTAYKLTGGVFSRRPAHLEKARREFRVGNLYLNRGITGALVGRQPFGGFGLSGLGSKAGGREYLLHFVEPRVCTENTMRRGFAPNQS
jgi:RHH-type proline utilization regulon transcriptional repressor/proline dehydrogenase/delta 1-pyrroline-5-carboxylate dehydrogenase